MLLIFFFYIMNGSILYDFCELMREYLYNDMFLMLIIVLLYMFNVVYFIFIKKKNMEKC